LYNNFIGVNMTQKELLGVIPRERIRILEIKRPSKEIIEEYLKVKDMSGSAARALDLFGIWGAINTAALKPLIEGKSVVGPAITCRDVPSRIVRYYGILNREPSYQKGESEAYFVGEPGDVIVIDSGGQTIASNMGGGSAALAKARGIAGSIVDGLCTGVPGIRAVDYPVWCRGGTPNTGHHRLETVEINGTIACAGVQVQPGDLIVADDSGVTVVPSKMIEDVLDIMKRKAGRAMELVKMGAKPSEIGKDLAQRGRDDGLLLKKQ
jgi:regulator of RNase E activity RraA